MDIILVLAAIIPAIALAVFVFVKDRTEKEPIGLLIALLALGMATCIPAAVIETCIEAGLNAIFEPFGSYYKDTLSLSGMPYYIYNFIWSFFGVAFVEEALKWTVLLLMTRNNKNFNSLFDGIIYAVFVSLGFAGFENVLYVLGNGLGNALLRALTAVPGHMFNAVFMGMFYSLWKIYKKADEYELRYQMQTNTKVDFFKPGYYLALSIIVPTATHGFYDFCCFVSTTFTMILFVAFLIFLYIFCFIKINKFSRQDTDIASIAIRKFRAMYPDVPLEEIAVNSDDITRPEITQPDILSSTSDQLKVYVTPNGDRYVGALVDGKYSGYGVYYFAMGGKYEGNFENGMFNGNGTYFSPDGSKFVGMWQNNKQNGFGTLYNKDGTHVLGLWMNGSLVSNS